MGWVDSLTAYEDLQIRVLSRNDSDLEILVSSSLRNVEKLMRLQAQAPMRMLEAILYSKLRVFFNAGTIHGLEKKMGEVPIEKQPGFGAGLGVDQL